MIFFSKQIHILFLFLLLLLTLSSQAQKLQILETGTLEFKSVDSSDALAKVLYKAGYANDSLKIYITGADSLNFGVNKNIVLPVSDTIALDSVLLNFHPDTEREYFAFLNFSIKNILYAQFALLGQYTGAVTVKSITQSDQLDELKVSNGNLLVESQTPVLLEIYDSLGRLYRRVNLQANSKEEIKLNLGVWIVRFGSAVYKFKI